MQDSRVASSTRDVGLHASVAFAARIDRTQGVLDRKHKLYSRHNARVSRDSDPERPLCGCKRTPTRCRLSCGSGLSRFSEVPRAKAGRLIRLFGPSRQLPLAPTLSPDVGIFGLAQLECDTNPIRDGRDDSRCCLAHGKVRHQTHEEASWHDGDKEKVSLQARPGVGFGHFELEIIVA